MGIDPYEFLIVLINETEKVGRKFDQSRFRFGIQSSKDVELILSRFPDNTFEDILEVVNVCIARDYMSHAELGNKFNVKLTGNGFDAGQLKRESLASLGSETKLMKVSKWIEKHNGVVTLYATFVATLALILNFV